MKFLKTNLEGKVRNLPHFKGEALLPVFEAVVNSIQAIEERGNLSGGEIEVRVVREAQGMLGDMDESGITGFVITDNGIGFDEANYDSFETSDSIHKQALGGKGKGPRGQAWFIDIWLTGARERRLPFDRLSSLCFWLRGVAPFGSDLSADVWQQRNLAKATFLSAPNR